MRKTYWVYFTFIIFLNGWGTSLIAQTEEKKTEEPKLTIDLPAEHNSWEEFFSYPGKFRIITPGQLSEKVDSIYTDIGTLAYHTFYYQADEKKADNLVYMISYCDYPDYTVHSDSLSLVPEFFEATIESAVSSVKGELIYSNDIQIKRYPGKVWRIDYLRGRAVIKTKAFIVKNRFYTLQTITYKERNLNYSTDKFLESFRLLE